MTETLPEGNLRHTADLAPPPGFVFDPDMMESYEEQVAAALRTAAYQMAPTPSFEDVPKAAVVPTFNPSNAPAEEVYARDRVPSALRRLGSATHAELTGDVVPVDMWRVIDRGRVEDGTGLVSSRILYDNTLGDIEAFNPVKHLASNHESRSASVDTASPLVSFSTDPEDLARTIILKYGFGIKDGRDSVVVKVHVDPHRVITSGNRKEEEVLLIGGVAPEEYEAAYEVQDFIENVVPPDTELRMPSGTLHRDEAFRYWTQPSYPEPEPTNVG